MKGKGKCMCFGIFFNNTDKKTLHRFYSKEYSKFITKYNEEKKFENRAGGENTDGIFLKLI
jgi:hypothetical protein